MLNIIREGRAKKEGTILMAPYARVSTDKDDQQNSLASQRDFFFREIEATPGLELYNEYYDEGISGTSLKKRENFNRMIADARTGRIDVIITKEVSRFARNTVDTLSITRELKALGIQVIFLNDGINTFDKDGELRLTIMASMAQDESRKTSERVKWGQTRRMEQGIVFGRDMLGYDVKGGKMFINPEGAEVVKRIFEKYLYEGKGAFRIARDLQEEGIPTYRGDSRWTAKVIYAILRNEKYVGDLEQKKTYTPDYLSHNKKYNRGVEEKVFISNHHEPIISREMWDMVQDEIQRRGEMITQEQRSKHSNLYWCSGKIRCAECGSRFMRRVKRLSNGGERRSWICDEAVRFGNRKIGIDGKPIGCDMNSVNEQVLKYCVRYSIQHVQFHQERLTEQIMAEVKEIQQLQNPYDVEKLQKKIHKLESEKRKAIKLRIDDEISQADLKSFTDDLNQQIQSYREQIQAAYDFEQKQEELAGEIAEYVQSIQKILNSEDAMICDDEAFLGEMLEQVTVYQSNEVEVKLTGVPFSFRLKYVTSGRGESFRVRVNHQEIIWSNE